jgi:hypothetical protein
VSGKATKAILHHVSSSETDARQARLTLGVPLDEFKKP